jgi:hypothetical protein
VNNDCSQLVALITQQGLTFDNLTCSQLRRGVARRAINSKSCERSGAGVTNSTKDAS